MGPISRYFKKTLKKQLFFPVVFRSFNCKTFHDEYEGFNHTVCLNVLSLTLVVY